MFFSTMTIGVGKERTCVFLEIFFPRVSLRMGYWKRESFFGLIENLEANRFLYIFFCRLVNFALYYTRTDLKSLKSETFLTRNFLRGYFTFYVT